MKRLFRLLGLLVALLVSAPLLVSVPRPALAQDDDEEAADEDLDAEEEEGDDEDGGGYARTGLYLRGSGQVAAWTSTRGFLFAPEVEWQPDFGLDATVGWRESERLALELEFEWVINHEDVSLGSWLFGANAKFFFSESRLQPYLIVGAGAMWSEVPGALDFADDWAFRNGLGLDYYIDDHWALSFETTFVWGVGDLWENYFLTYGVGLMYRF